MKRFGILILSITLISWHVQAQEIYFDAPVALPETINSEAEESKPMLSNDGKQFYFVRTVSELNNGGMEGGQDIWLASNDRGSFGNVTNNVTPLNNNENNAVVGLSADGRSLYVINSYTPQRVRRQGIAVTEYKGNSWTYPSEIDIEVKVNDSYYDFYLTPNEDVLLISMSDDRSLGDQDLYVTVKGDNGKWVKPIHLGDVINTKDFEVSPFLAKDGKTLYFASDGHDGMGDADIFRSTRLDDTWQNWSEPENLGSSINSEKFDAYFFMTEDSTVYFASNRDKELSDIYQTSMRLKNPPLIAEKEEDKPALGDTDAGEQAAEEEEADKAPREAPQAITVYFGFDDASLSTTAKRELLEVVDQMTNQPDLEITILGHTCSLGNADYNLKLSERRASSVRSFLMGRDIASSRILMDAKGESQFATGNATTDQRSKNRRAEVIFAFEEEGKRP